MIHYKETEYGFEFGSAKITRLFSDNKKDWITFGLETPKYKGANDIQIYVTKTGKVRIFDSNGEWAKPEKKRDRSEHNGNLRTKPVPDSQGRTGMDTK